MPQRTPLSFSRRMWPYPLALFMTYLGWLGYMALSGGWGLFERYWPMSLTMLFGSFVAGSTAGGSAVIAFPVFTKLFEIPSADARIFGLMIQTFGMNLAALVILLRREMILPSVIFWATLGGLVGMTFGTLFLAIPEPYPKVLFTLLATLFGLALLISRFVLTPKKGSLPPTAFASWTRWHRLTFLGVGLVGGAVSSVLGSGIDLLTFMVLTLAFGIDAKVATFTSIPIMGMNSLIGFFLHGAVVQDIGVVWSYWLVCIPVVVLGAPFGALVISYLNRERIVQFLLVLIAIEFMTTLLLVPFTPALVLYSVLFVGCGAVCFGSMLLYQYRKLIMAM